MLELDAREFIELIHALLATESQIRGQTGELTPMLRATRDQANDEMIASLKRLELPVSVKTAQEMVMGAKTIEALHKAIEQLWNTVAMELDGRKFYGPLTKFASYYEQPKLFGDEVFDKFPSANNDIFEAGTCLALERGTACVMHLMRVLEAGLAALAATVNVQPQNDWGAYLRKIDEELAKRQKASGARTADEQFYAEVSTHLGHMRVAWRNPTMHVEKSYSPDRAEDILRAVRAFMQHLATRISE